MKPQKPLELPKSSGAALRRLRENLGLTREQFGKPLLVNQDRLRDFEREVASMKGAFWLLVLITYDPQMRAKWTQWIERFLTNHREKSG